MPQLPGLRSRTQSLASSVNQNGNERPTSPTFSTTTTASGMNLPASSIITRADLRASIGAYSDLVSATANYRAALSTLSHGSARLADALEKCARLKGVTDDVSIGLQAASGLHHLIANHEQVLGRSLHNNVEELLKKHLDEYKNSVAERSAAYERSLVEKSKIIRQTELENMNYGRRKQRDLNSFRNALNILQAQVNDLDRLKTDYYASVLQHENEVWEFVMGKVSLSVRSTLDVYDRITAKSSDPHLEPLLLSIPDPFDSYGPPKREDHIFSILPPLSLATMMSTNSSAPSPQSGNAALPKAIPNMPVNPIFRSGAASPAIGSPEMETVVPSASRSAGALLDDRKSHWSLPTDEPVIEHSQQNNTLRKSTATTTTYYPSMAGFEWADAHSPTYSSHTSSPSSSLASPSSNVYGRRPTLQSNLTSPSSTGVISFPISSPTSGNSNNGFIGITNGGSRAESKLRTVLSASSLGGDDDGKLRPPSNSRHDEESSEDEDNGDVWGRTTPVGPSSRSVAESKSVASMGDATPRKSAFDHLQLSDEEAENHGPDVGVEPVATATAVAT
ncbi:hypothetical protein FRC03_002624 [Tulasnella sp. 419]|nr:hypothetical protein FRC03_002624 [Tulasnella sp. 419]